MPHHQLSHAGWFSLNKPHTYFSTSLSTAFLLGTALGTALHLFSRGETPAISSVRVNHLQNTPALTRFLVCPRYMLGGLGKKVVWWVKNSHKLWWAIKYVISSNKLFSVCRCPSSLKLLWAIPNYSLAAGKPIAESSRSTGQNQTTTRRAHDSPLTRNSKAEGAKGPPELGWSLGMLTSTLAGNSHHAHKELRLLEKGTLKSTHQLELGWGKAKQPCTLEHKIQGEEPLGKETRQTWKCRGIHWGPFGSVSPFWSLYAHEFVHWPAHHPAHCCCYCQAQLCCRQW